MGTCPSVWETLAFRTRDGLCRWKILSFRLDSPIAVLQRLMEHVLHGLYCKALLLHLDDIIPMSSNLRCYTIPLAEIFDWLKQAVLKVKPTKHAFMETQVSYLDHLFSATGVATDSENIEVIPNGRSQPMWHSWDPSWVLLVIIIDMLMIMLPRLRFWHCSWQSRSAWTGRFQQNKMASDPSSYSWLPCLNQTLHTWYRSR